jgi:hypothetical protein
VRHRPQGVDRSLLYRHRDLHALVIAKAVEPPMATSTGPAVSRASLLADLASAHERVDRIARENTQLRRRLSEVLGEQAWRESGLGGPDDIQTLQRRITDLEQHAAPNHGRESLMSHDDARMPASMTLNDGRHLTWHEYGDLTGRPCLFLPGAATSGRAGAVLDAASTAGGIRLVSVDRPGLGHSAGGTYALAVAHGLADRVGYTVVGAGSAPYSEDWTRAKGMMSRVPALLRASTSYAAAVRGTVSTQYPPIDQGR